VLITARWSRKIANGRKIMTWKGSGRYAGIGIAIDTLIENIVRVTIRHSDSEPIASVAATASFSREEATGVERPLKPVAPGVRIMTGILERGAGESPATCENFAAITGNIAAASGPKMAKSRRKRRLCPLFQQLCPLFQLLSLGGDAGRVIDFGVRAPFHGDKA
jgi:hypothetical protein